ncbi:MAG: type VI secretion system tube protein Hcp [Rudaea sp.]
MTRALKLVGLFVLGFFGFHAHAALADTLVLCDSMSSELKGESQAAGAIGCIDVLSWSWSGTTVVIVGGGGGGAGKPTLAEFSLQKPLDSSSTSLFRFLVSGAPLKGTLQFRQYGQCAATCSNPIPYLTIDMTKARVTSQSLGGSEEQPSESIKFLYDAYKLCYRPTDSNGVLGTQTCQMFTISTNTITP